MIISTLWHSFPRFIQSQRLFWRRSKYLQHLCTLYGNIFHSCCNSHIIIVGILVHLKQWWRIQGAPEQRHRWRCSADSPKFPDYLQPFPSRTLPGSAMVTHAFQIWNETKQSRNQHFANIFFEAATDANTPSSVSAKFQILRVRKIILTEKLAIRHSHLHNYSVTRHK